MTAAFGKFPKTPDPATPPRGRTRIGWFQRNAVFLLLYALRPLIVGFLVVYILLPLLYSR